MFSVGDKVAGERFFVLEMKESLTKGASPRPYVTLTVTADGRQRLTGNKWNHTLSDVGCEVDDTITFDALITEYEGTPQLDFKSSISRSSEPLTVKATKIGVTLDTVTKDFEQVCSLLNPKSMAHDFMQSFISSPLYNEFLAAPGAVNIHHAYECGNAEHSVAVARLVIPRVSEKEKNLAIVASLLHDVGKVRSYEFAGPAIKETWEGKMLGHIVLGLGMIGPMLAGYNEEFSTLLLNAIAGHHGKLEWGSPILPKTKFALILAQADLYDARAQHMNDMEEWEGWSKRDRIAETELWMI